MDEIKVRVNCENPETHQHQVAILSLPDENVKFSTGLQVPVEAVKDVKIFGK